jgi:hypothetical protein
MRVRARFILLASAASACGGDDDAGAPVTGQPAPGVAESARPETPAFPPGTQSLVLTRTVNVRIEPGEHARGIGTIGIDTRVGWTGTASAKGCVKDWVEIAPHGWVCGEYLQPSTKPPLGREIPVLERGELVPGIYGKVTATSPVTYVLETKPKPASTKKPAGAVTSPGKVDSAPPESRMIEGKPLVGSVNVRQYEQITVAGKAYWKINQKQNEYVLGSAIAQHKPSLFGGTRLGDDTGLGAQIGFVIPRWGGQQAWTTSKPRAYQRRQIAQRTPVPLLETAADPKGKIIAYRIGTDEWIDAGDVRVFTPQPPPPALLPGERWIDVDLDSQMLVAFEGDLPVYATLVSSGTKDTPTETGVYRMWLKASETDMKGLSGEDPYSVATVPWTQFFSPERGLALHTAYWHDQFGTPRSHGCVNLAPRDARWLYFWSDPQVPAGWTSATGISEAPGSIVRIRSKADPTPIAKGYAKKVQEIRQGSGG